MRRFHIYLIVMFFLSMTAFAAGIVIDNVNLMILSGLVLTTYCIVIGAEIFGDATA